MDAMKSSTPVLRFALGVALGIGLARVSALPPDDEQCSDQQCFTPGTLRIPRERNLNLKDYYEKYEDTQTPVIIEDYADVFEGMSESNIMDVCGQYNTTIARRVMDEGAWANIQWYENGLLADTMRQVALASEISAGDDYEPVEGSVLGVFDWSLQKLCPELLEKHFIVPKYLAQDYLQRVPHSIDLNYRDSWPSLFVGVDGTYGGAHRDVFGSAFWMFVIEGAKEWVVVDSADDADFFGPDAPHIRHFHDIVSKGQLLIIPGHRWHQVRNKGRTLTVAGNFISRGSFGAMKREVRRDSNKGSYYYKQLEETLLLPGFDTSIDYDQGDVTWKEFRAPVGESKLAMDEKFAVLVTGAGSSEVNGCYLFNGMNGDAWQFELRNVERSFEIFQVAGSGWWNIQEYIDDSYSNPVHYGAPGDSDSVLPGSDGWGSTEYTDSWLGNAPMPKVEVIDRKTCMFWGAHARKDDAPAEQLSART